MINKRRLEHRIDGLKSRFADIEHQRNLLRQSYIHAKASEDRELTEDLALKIRTFDRQLDAVAAEIESLSYRRYYTEKMETAHDAP